VVPGWVPWRQLRLACWPSDLFDRLKSLPGFNQRELAMDIKLEEKATEGCSNQEYESWVEFHIRREENWKEILRYLVQEEPSELTAVLFDGVDKLQHLCWRFIDPAYAGSIREDWERRVHDLCVEYFRRLDGMLEEMCGWVGPEATVLITSDHGFGPTAEVLNLNAWLEQRGHLTWSDKAAKEPSDGALLGVGQVARHTYLMDWTKTNAFAATPTSNGIYIVVSKDGAPPGVPASEYVSFREKLKRELAAFRHPETGEAVVEQVYTRDEAFDGPAKHMAPDLTLILRDGGLVSILPADKSMSPRPVVAGSHRPLGVFMAKGPGIRKGADIKELSILDVAPAALYGLGLPVPEDMEGAVPEAAYEPAALQQNPVRKTAGSKPDAAGKAPQHGPVAIEPEDEMIVVERLRQLGYIE